MAKTNAPVNRYRFGNVTVNVWESEVGKGKDSFKTYSVTISKSYKDKDGKWQNTSSFKFNEVPYVIMGLQEAMAEKYRREDITEVEVGDEEL